MSINSIQSSPGTNPWNAVQSGASASRNAAPTGSFMEVTEAQAGFGTTGPAGLSSGQSPAGTGGANASPASSLQNLTSELQTWLLQSQSDGANGIASTEQGGANDPQSLFGGGQAANGPNTQTANANPTAPAGETVHHHHRRQVDDGEANGASAVAAGSTTDAPAADGPSAATSLVTGIAQAIQAYGGSSIAAAAPLLMMI